MQTADPAVHGLRAMLAEAIGHAAHFLPAQGPIGVFIHHNTLHAFEHLPFEEAVVHASRMFGTEPYMTEEQFRAAVEKGRISIADIDAVLEREPNAAVVPGRLDRRRLRRLMLIPGARRFDPRTIRWEVEEGSLRAPQTRTLFHACLDRVEPVDAGPAEFEGARENEINPLLIKLCGAFLDQGMAYWPMPSREEGFYLSVRNLYAVPGAVLPRSLESAPAEFRRQAAAECDAEAAVLDCLDQLCVPSNEWERFLIGQLHSLSGWAGLIRRLEVEPDLAPHEAVPCSLMDYLAVRLTFVLAAGMQGTDKLPSEPDAEALRLCRAAELCDVATLAELSAADIIRLDPQTIARLQDEIAAFDDLERRRVFQLAYELWHERRIVGPLALHRRMIGTPRTDPNPFAQVFFCIDEREESIRRHLEELAPDFETLAAAGFYGVAVDYHGIDEAHGVALCPVVVKPRHAVRERPVSEDKDVYRRRKALRSLWAKIRHNAHISSRTLARGTLSTAVLGLFSLFPLIAHVLSPRRYSKFVEALNRWVLPEPRTELTLMRQDDRGHVATDKLLLGFSITEKADRVESVLRPAGLTKRFAPIVVVLGHGSTSLNNPHESAHDCGACGGRRGGPNARLFASMANNPAVRELLGQRGVHIPEGTWFVGGYHDTCSDEIQYFDTEEIPTSLKEHFETVRARMEDARHMDAHERARRFEAAGRRITPEQALWHVQERSEHLAEPRPEYGHCTNAVCIVGRRALTRGLFFDRRAFLVSYEPEGDANGESLAKLLAAGVPVCAGISLEYYFSFVDNEGYGCGTKLPHNVSGLVGVMNGASSDLRTGLPWQMVEIHEPVRILFIVESTPEILGSVVSRNPGIAKLVANRWVRVATMDPHDGTVHVWRDGVFEPYDNAADCALPAARSSRDWYEGRLEHLPVARIGA